MFNILFCFNELLLYRCWGDREELLFSMAAMTKDKGRTRGTVSCCARSLFMPLFFCFFLVMLFSFWALCQLVHAANCQICGRGRNSNMLLTWATCQGSIKVTGGPGIGRNVYFDRYAPQTESRWPPKGKRANGSGVRYTNARTALDRSSTQAAHIDWDARRREKHDISSFLLYL
jgi:hypothetical protein